VVTSLPAAVAEIEELAPSVLQLTIDVHDDGFSFRPGQWVNFRFPEGVSRAYTIASPPERPKVVELCVRVGAGKGGAALKALLPGAAVSIEGPYGDFLLPDNDGRAAAFLAGDTGIAPVRSIVLHMLATNDPRRILVLYEPDQRYILYAADFDPLARSGAIAHESGAIETLIARNRPLLAESLVMVAGFDPFLARVNAAFRENAIPTDGIIEETFGALP
jgi:ferredoxin-NADP reductase